MSSTSAAAGMRSSEDHMAAWLAAYATGVDEALGTDAMAAAKRALFDAIAVATGAFRHRAAQAARRYAMTFCSEAGASIWGSGTRVAPEAATLANGVLLRCYDFNDLYVGKRSAGHPSDIIAGLIAVAEARNLSGKKLLFAIALAYEVVLSLLDSVATGPGGWDYANLTAIGAACAVARLMGLTEEQTREALAITVVPHLASDEIESGDLNRRGDLAMWKRFNGADAVRHAVYACTLASCGVEGAVRPFTGRMGLLAKLGADEDPMPYLQARLAPRRALSRIAEVTMKRWPVGSRAQSAVQAALAARAKVSDVSRIKEIRVVADPAAYRHLVRENAWRPMSRETADHSLPFIVGTAVLDGEVTADSFRPERVVEAQRQSFLQKIRVMSAARAEDAEVAKGYAATYRTSVEIEAAQGETVSAEAEIAPGHPESPLTDADLVAKLLECARGDLNVELLAKTLWGADALESVCLLTRQLVVTGERNIGATTAT